MCFWITFISLLLLNLLVLSNTEPNIDSHKDPVDCSKYTDCDTCFDDTHCAFWYCHDKDVWTGGYACEAPSVPKPTAPCAGKWKRIERPSNCSEVHGNGTTTTTTTNTTTTTTTKSPNTTTSTSTIKPTTTVPNSTSTVSPKPDDSDRKLTGWTITGIVVCSLLVIGVLLGVAYKKVMKIYRARNPYRTLND